MLRVEESVDGRKESRVDKPKMTPRSPAYDYHDVIAWIEQKHEIDTRDFEGKFNRNPYDETVPYHDFWHWVMDAQWYGEVHNRSYQDLLVSSKAIGPETWDKQPEWVNKILTMIDQEFPEAGGCLHVWVAW